MKTRAANITTSEKLKRQLKKDKEFIEGDIHLRLHRAISWIKAAEEQETQDDIKFISLWIAFNACYAVDNFNELSDKTTLSEKKQHHKLHQQVACLRRNQTHLLPYLGTLLFRNQEPAGE